MNHTPGPWIVERLTNVGRPHVCDARARVIAYMGVAARKEQDANAALIAAAPETKRQRDRLLAALKALQRATLTAHIQTDVISEVHAAIAEAEGGEA